MHAGEKIALLLFFLTVGGVYFLEGALLIRFVVGLAQKRKGPKVLLKKWAIALHAVAALGIGCLFYGLFIEPSRIEVNIVPIATSKLEKANFRIVQISDLHCDRKMRNEERMAELINSLEADVVVFTGDALNTAEAAPMFKSTMKSLNASLGKFAVRGNFEVNSWRNLDLYSDTGFELLNASSAALSKGGETIHISGLSCDNPGGLEAALSSVGKNDYSVFLYHFSDLVESLERVNVDLYLSGHTHGGQVALPFYGAIITLSKFGKKYESGMYRVGETILYVNRGIGLEPRPAPQIRFGARPEITVFDIGPAKKSMGAN